MLRLAVGMWLELAPKHSNFQMARSPFSASWDLSSSFLSWALPKVFGAGGPASCSWEGARCQVWGPEASRGGVEGLRRKTRRMGTELLFTVILSTCWRGPAGNHGNQVRSQSVLLPPSPRGNSLRPLEMGESRECGKGAHFLK